jgi:hypothetical protein
MKSCQERAVTACGNYDVECILLEVRGEVKDIPLGTTHIRLRNNVEYFFAHFFHNRQKSLLLSRNL